MSIRVQLPPQLVEDAKAFSDGSREPAEPRNAATVVLLRAGSDGPEVYLLRRQTSMAFAGGMCVFPGGASTRATSTTRSPGPGRRRRSGPPQLGTDEATARALVCAAVRETFEESGVLLAGDPPRPSSPTPPATTGSPTGPPSRPASWPSPSSSTAVAWCCAPTSSGCGRPG